MFQKNNMGKTDYETIIGSNIKIKGTLKGGSNILIQGNVEGNIETEGDIKIEEGAQITAQINANNILISGEINGNIFSKDKIIVRSSGKVIGDIQAQTIEIESGAVFNGKSTMGSNNNSKKEN